MMQAGTFFAIYLAPILFAAVFYGRRITRRQAEAERVALPFDPKPIPAPTGVLRNLPAPHRVYLAQQFKFFLMVYIMLAWTELFIFSLQFLNTIGNTALWYNLDARTWFLFLRNASHTNSFFAIFLLGCAFFVIAPLRVGATALLHRTRPISISFLFWTRTAAVLLALCLATLTAIGLAFALLIAVKGPIWHNLPTTIPRALSPDDADLAREYANLLVTSAPRIFLSLLTTITLSFSLLIALFTIPSRFLTLRNGGPVTVIVTIFVVAVLSQIFLVASLFANFPPPPRILFLYTELGTPPPYLYALGPIVLSAAFLLLARIFVRRIEL